MLNQIAAIIAMNVKSLPRRANMSVAAVAAIAAVVAVLLGFLAMANGLQQTISGSGSDDFAIILRANSSSELNSTLTKDQQDLIALAPGFARGPGGRPLVSRESYVIVDGIKKSSDTKANIPLRGMSPEGVALRSGVRVTEGRMFEAGLNELVVGAGVLREFAGFEMGKEIRFGRSVWRVVGVFEAPGSVFESELWADIKVVQGQFNRGASVQTMRAKLAVPGDISTPAAYIENEPRLNADIKTERTYFAGQSQGTQQLVTLGWALGIAMALGSLSGALNTMYASVQARTRDIATLRTLGFGGFATFVGTVVESLVLAAIGGLIGGVVAFLFLDGITASTLSGSFTQVVFAFDLSPQLLADSVVLALVIGAVGGIFPAWRASRLPLTAAFGR